MQNIPFKLQNASRSQRDNIFAQASLSKAVWALAVQIMDGFEAGELKDQNLSMKQLMSKPEFKQPKPTACSESSPCIPSKPDVTEYV